MDYVSKCKEIYLSAFSDDGEFCQKLFEKCRENIEYLKDGENIASYLFLLPCKIGGEKAKYIFAAATKKEFQGKGYMSRLLEKVKEENKLLFLRPATKELIGFYERFGFKEITATAKGDAPVLEPDDSFLEFAKITESDSETEYPFMYLSSNGLSFDKIHFEYSMD